jgi:hypothetical protein
MRAIKASNRASMASNLAFVSSSMFAQILFVDERHPG